jgi:hypothetical protein
MRGAVAEGPAKRLKAEAPLLLHLCGGGRLDQRGRRKLFGESSALTWEAKGITCRARVLAARTRWNLNVSTLRTVAKPPSTWIPWTLETLRLEGCLSSSMPPSAMAMPGQHMTPGSAPSNISAGVDPAFWGGHQDFQSSDSTSPLSPSLGLHLSPTASFTTQSSANGGTPPAQTPQSDSGSKRSGQKTSQKQSPSDQTRASVAVACVPCRSRHLKCDGGVRCSRCRTDNVECTYIKSRRGWKGKRKTKDENASRTASNGGC